MLSLGPTTRVFVARDPVDMRGSFDALAGRIRRMGLDPLDGGLYVFVSRRRHLLAVLSYDGSGWCLYRKRLSRGSFQLPDIPDDAHRIAVDGRVLAAMLCAALMARYLGGAKLQLDTLIRGILTLPGERLRTATTETIRIYRHDRDRELMPLVEEACKLVTARELVRNGRRLRFELVDHPNRRGGAGRATPADTA